LSHRSIYKVKPSRQYSLKWSFFPANKQLGKRDSYFGKPYHSWEYGQNANANGLLRQYCQKSIELVDVTDQLVTDAVHKLNRRAR